MGTISKTYEVGDTVWVAYPFPSSLAFTAQSRVVSKVDVLAASNEANVSFTDGGAVLDGAVQTVYLTEALAAAAIVTDVIAKSAATVALDATLSVASTASQASTTLGRIG